MSHDKKYYGYLSPATAGAAMFGALVGGAAAAASNVRKVRSGEMTASRAALDVLREAGTTGLASGAGVAAMNALRLGGVPGLIGIVAVAAGSKYLLDAALAKVSKAGFCAVKSGPAAQAAQDVAASPAAEAVIEVPVVAAPAPETVAAPASETVAAVAPEADPAPAEVPAEPVSGFEGAAPKASRPRKSAKTPAND